MTPYPFSAVVGMDDLKLALLINAVSPSVGGVLVRGEKGTAKSTIVRALASLLPQVAVIEDCRFSCDPEASDPECPDGPHDDCVAERRSARLVELPVGASEDRLVGSLDLEAALTTGVTVYEPGLLAAAHRGLLYVDEVNLLHDHLVDLLLDAAAMGRSFVEREGVSIRHAARFLLVGTMNPEEGELRPQLLDRFGLTVQVAATRVPAERAEVVRRRLRYEEDTFTFAHEFASSESELSVRIEASRRRLPYVTLGDGALEAITAVCAGFEVDGLRADLVTARASLALAAWHDRTTVTEADVRQAARLALPHRRRRDPFDAPGLDEAKLDALLAQHPFDPPPDDDGPGPDSDGEPGPEADAEPGREADAELGQGADAPDPKGSSAEPARSELDEGATEPASAHDEPRAQAEADQGIEGAAASDGLVTAPGGVFKPRLFTVDGLGEGAPGRRSKARSPYGRVSGSVPGVKGLHLTATLRAAAPHQRARGRSGPGLVMASGDFREALREGREGNLVLFVVDASGSMAARQRMRAVKSAALSLLMDAYQRRDKVGLVTFRGTSAELALPPTSSVEAGARRLEKLPTGGRTPLAAGLVRSAEVLRIEKLRDPSRRPLLVLVTDGRATYGPDPLTAVPLLAGVQTVVVDCETGPVRLGLAATLGVHLAAEIVPLEELDALASVVRQARSVA